MKRIRIALQGLMLAAVFSAFFGGGALTASLMRFQAGPLLLRTIRSLSVSAGCLLLLLLLLTWAAGRFYCGFLCPLGCFQDLAGTAVRRKKRFVPDLPYLRLLVAGLALGLAAGGWSAGFLLLDPYSNAGRMISVLSPTVGAVWLLLILLVLWKKRLFCTAVCPVGTTLGLAAEKGLFRLKIRETCVRCGQCAAVRPAGAVDLNAKRIDNGRCLRCMECLSVCRTGSIGFGLPEKTADPLNRSRRDFLLRSGILLVGAAAGFSLGMSGLRKRLTFGSRTRVLPPGAGEPERFFSRCTACQLCVKNCPAGIIVPGEQGVGPVSLDLSKGVCLRDCRRCSEICPTGALSPLTLKEKQHLRIAEARFEPRNCRVFQDDEPCGKCAGVCPAGAIRLRKSGAPYPVVPDRCIGCGACQNVCPASPKAMRILEIEKQIKIGKV